MTTAEQLKQDILKKCTEYYNLVHKKDEEIFDEEHSYVNYAGRVFDEKEITNLVDASLEFWLTYGRYSKEFEKKFSEFLGVKFALLANSGSSANLLAFMALTSPLLKEKRVKRGDEVITVAAGFPTTVAPIVQYGAVPVFVDITLETYNIKIEALEKAISDKTKAVMIAHTLGNPFDIKAVKAFCEKYDLWLIEDNCDALGSKYDNKYTGTFGDISTSSFYPPHHMTMGEGGAVYTNSPLFRRILLSMRDWGRDCFCDSGKDNTCGHRFSQQHGTLPFGYDHKFVYSHFGYNLKPTDLQAAIGCAQLDKLPDFVKQRKENFQTLYEGLQEYSNFFILPEATKSSSPSWFGFILTLQEDLPFTRQEIVNYLEKQRIQTRNLFAGNIVRQPLFTNLQEGKDYNVCGNLENTDIVMNRSFWLGVYPGMKTDALEYMISSIKKFIHLYD